MFQLIYYQIGFFPWSRKVHCTATVRPYFPHILLSYLLEFLSVQMRTAVVIQGQEEQQEKTALCETVAEEELVIRQYCMLIVQICGGEEDMLNRPWRTKVLHISHSGDLTTLIGAQ